MATTWTSIGPAGHFYECPRWHDGSWWVSDFYADELVNLAADGEVIGTISVPGHPGGTGWLSDGTMLVGSMLHKLLFTVRDGALEEYADLSALSPGRLNDLVISDRDIVYAGNFGFDLMSGGDVESTVLIAVGPDREPRVVADDVCFPNGMSITADGSTLIVGETFAARHSAYDIADDGSLSGRRTWYRDPVDAPTGPLGEVLAGLTYAPDGCAIDENDELWVADALNGTIVHLSEAGGLLETLELPDGLNAYACGFGGLDGDVLLATCAPSFAEHERVDTRDSVLFQTTTTVRGSGRR